MTDEKEAPPTPREAAARLAALKALKDAVDVAYEAAKSVALEVMDRGDRKVARLPDETHIGTVTVTNPKAKAAIHDPAAFLDHVKTTRPDEVITYVDATDTDEDLIAWAREHRPHWIREKVRNSYAKHLLDLAEAEGSVAYADGEIIADGIEVEPRNPWVTMTQSEPQAVAVLDALDRADLSATDLMVDTNDAYNALAIDAGTD